MGKAIVWAILLLLAFGAWSWFCAYVGSVVASNRIIRQGGASAAGVTLIKEAHAVFTEQLMPSTLIQAGGYDMLSADTTKKVNAWMQAYNKWRGKAR
jgi:hypothetical protein